ncbi:MAG: SDR family oxidoreductase [Bacteroidetes bacterium]|nr:SDR family oxidoreductase [Bacteroidota bacterium]
MLTGKVAVITGASSGIGASLATRLSQDGCTVVLAARRKEKLEEVARQADSAGGTVLPVQCDVSVCREAEGLIQKTVETFGKIDILINNAGRGHFSSVEETTDDVLESMFALNVFALWYTTRPALRHMKHQGNGHIINIASIAGKLGFPYNSAYVAAKHACVGFTHALRLELAETGIHATVVCPAGVQTDWAQVTEGSPIIRLFSEAGPIIKRIAAQRGISLPRIEGVLSADVVAEQIRACIENPVAELFTHKGSQEFTALAAQNREQTERQQLPVALGERSVYERLKTQA